MKRRIALLSTLGRINDAIDALVELLDASPTDIEAWSELADLYLSQGLFSQAEYCLEEVLLVAPNAWNVCDRWPTIIITCANGVFRFMPSWASFCIWGQAVTKAVLLKFLPSQCAASVEASNFATTISEAIMGSNW